MDKPKITAKILDNILANKLNEVNYPKEKEGIRKFTLETRDAIENSTQCLLAIATIAAKSNNIEEAIFKAFSAGIVIGYTTKEAQIEKIIDEI